MYVYSITRYTQHNNRKKNTEISFSKNSLKKSNSAKQAGEKHGEKGIYDKKG